MPLTDPFEEHTDRYDRWFETYDHASRSEVLALQRLVPASADGVEIGVGTGRFADPLGIRIGLDPSDQMLQRAAERGIEVVKGVAKALPFEDDAFNTALIVTTICFVDDVSQTLEQARRILSPDGQLVIGYIDKESPVGQQYQQRKDDNPFYRDATFVSTDELVEMLEMTGFGDLSFVQTMFHTPDDLTKPDRVTDGYGDGLFVGLKAQP